jgi:dTDP-4-dehydrorhamnose reductase
MKVLIIGGSGLLGRKLSDQLEQNGYDVHLTYWSNKIQSGNSYPLDITNTHHVERLFHQISPDVVIHCAAYTKVDDCEKNKDIAYTVNVTGTYNIALSSQQVGAKVIFISTDYVFDGEAGYYKEEDKTSPVNYYGYTKLEGEHIIKIHCKHFLIARTSVLFGSQKTNFVIYVLNKLRQGEHFTIIDDQFVSPTLNTDLAQQLLTLVEKNAEGVFHTAGGERISRYNFSTEIAYGFGYDTNLITPIKMKDVTWIARRPRDSSLDITKISPFKKPYKIRESLRMLKDTLGVVSSE